MARSSAFALAPVLVLFAACFKQQQVKFRITSDPAGAHVDVDGIAAGTTPTEVKFDCTKEWGGLASAPGGWKSHEPSLHEITAYPPLGAGGESQTKRIDPCEIRGAGLVHFDLRLVAAPERHRVELSIQDGASRRREALDALRKLRDAGVLTEDEYRRKVQLVEEETK